MSAGHGSDVGGWMENRLAGAAWGFAAYVTYLVGETLAHWTIGVAKPPLDFDGVWLFVFVGAIFAKWSFVLTGLMVLGNALYVQADRSRTPQEYLLGPVLFWVVTIVLGLIVYQTIRNSKRIKGWAVAQAASWKQTYKKKVLADKEEIDLTPAEGRQAVFDRIRHTPFKGWTLVAVALIVWITPRFAVFAAVAAGIAVVLWKVRHKAATTAGGTGGTATGGGQP